MPKLSRNPQSGFTIIEMVLVLLIIAILAAIISAAFAGVKSRDRNAERKEDIEKVQNAFETYYVLNNKYPSIAEANSTDWRTKNLKEFNQEFVRDPSSKALTFSTKAAEGQYAYIVTTSDGKSCDNKDRTCTQYTLVATYEGGGTYSRSSRN